MNLEPCSFRFDLSEVREVCEGVVLIEDGKPLVINTKIEIFYAGVADLLVFLDAISQRWKDYIETVTGDIEGIVNLFKDKDDDSFDIKNLFNLGGRVTEPGGTLSLPDEGKVLYIGTDIVRGEETRYDASTLSSMSSFSLNFKSLPERLGEGSRFMVKLYPFILDASTGLLYIDSYKNSKYFPVMSLYDYASRILGLGKVDNKEIFSLYIKYFLIRSSKVSVQKEIFNKELLSLSKSKGNKANISSILQFFIIGEGLVERDLNTSDLLWELIVFPFRSWLSSGRSIIFRGDNSLIGKEKVRFFFKVLKGLVDISSQDAKVIDLYSAFYRFCFDSLFEDTSVESAISEISGSESLESSKKGEDLSVTSTNLLKDLRFLFGRRVVDNMEFTTNKEVVSFFKANESLGFLLGVMEESYRNLKDVSLQEFAFSSDKESFVNVFSNLIHQLGFLEVWKQENKVTQGEDKLLLDFKNLLSEVIEDSLLPEESEEGLGYEINYVDAVIRDFSIIRRVLRKMRAMYAGEGIREEEE